MAMFLTSLDRASSRLYSRSGRASARSNKLAIVLPIDAIFAPPLQDRPRRSVRDPQIPIGRALQCLPPRGFLLGRLSDAGPGASPPPSQWAGVQNPSPFEASSTAVRYVRFTSIVSKNSDFRSITFLISSRRRKVV